MICSNNHIKTLRKLNKDDLSSNINKLIDEPTFLESQFKKFTEDSLLITLGLYISNIAYYKTNIDKIKLYDDYTVFDSAKGEEKLIKKWEQEIKKSIKNMHHIEIRYLYDYPIKNGDELKSGANSFYYDIPNYTEVDTTVIMDDANRLKENITGWEQELLKGYFKNRTIHTISIGIAPRSKIEYTTDKKGNKKAKAGNSKTSTAFNYFLIDIDIEDWKKPNYEPTPQEINRYINTFLNTLPKEAYKPYIIGFTGGGLRFIWYFNRPLTKLEIPILKRIAQDLRTKTNLDVDLKVYDIQRLDRLLGTENKKPEYGSPRKSRILYYYPDEVGYVPEEFYKQMGYDIKKVLEIIKQEGNKSNDDIALETINKIQKNNIIKDFKPLDRYTYNKTKRIQRELHNNSLKKHNTNYGWIIDLLDYLKVGYKTIGNRIHIYSLYCDDGDNPDTAIYINNGYDAVVKDFHLDASFNVVAYLWMAYQDKILEYLKINGLAYSLEDTTGIYKVIDEFFKLDTEIINISRYIEPNHIRTVLESSKDKIIGIKAPTGAGKTTAIINYTVNNNKKIIFLVPYYSMALQQAIQNKIKGFIGLHEKHQESDETIRKSTKIIATYDQLQKIVDIKGVKNLKDYIIVVDEYHNLITQYNLRYKAINRILDYKEAFKRVIYVSGTYEGLNIENNKIYEFKTQYNRKNNYMIKTCEKDRGLGHLINELKELDTSNGKYLVFINNIELIKQIEQELQQQGVNNIHILTAQNKNISDIFHNIYNEECLKENGLYITTSVICDGINLKDEDIKKIFIYGVYDIYQIGQYIARVRNAEPDIIHIIEPQKIRDMETYEDFIKSTENTLNKIIEPINENRKKAIKQGINLDEYKTELRRMPIYEEERYIKFNKYTKLYNIDKFKMTTAYLERLNLRILNDPKAIEEALLKFYPELNISIEKAKIKNNIEKKKTNKKELVEILIEYDEKTIDTVSKSRDELKACDDTGLSIEEVVKIKEVGKKHKKALDNIKKEKKYNEEFGIEIEIPKKDLDRLKEKYNIPEVPKEKEKELYIATANPKALGKRFRILETAKAIILEKEGKIKTDEIYTIEEWDYKQIKKVLDEIIYTHKEDKNIHLPTMTTKLKIKEKELLKIIKEYAKIKWVGKRTIKIIEINDTILKAWHKKVSKKNEVNYLDKLKEYTGQKLTDDEILELLDNKNDLLKKYWELGYLHNIKPDIYLIDV